MNGRGEHLVPAPTRWNHWQRDTHMGQPCPATVEDALRVAYEAGMHLRVGHRKLARLIRTFLADRPDGAFDVEAFSRWVYEDPTGDSAVWNIDGRYGGDGP